MSKWNGVVAALSSLLLAACGASDPRDSLDTTAQVQESTGLRQESPTPGFWPCGDGICYSAEIPRCPADCNYGGYCGDGYCEGPEDASNCPADCSGGGGCFAPAKP